LGVAAQGGVLFLDDDDDLRTTFIDLVSSLFDRSCLGVRSYRDLVSRGESALTCEIAILDINLGPDLPSGLDAYRWLRQRGFPGRIVFLTGHASSHPLVRRAHAIGDARIIAKPVSFDVIETLLHEPDQPREAPL
jgi:FixJ family two-component response regulator